MSELVGRQLAQIVFVMVLARLFSPAQFGIAAIAMLFVAVGSSLSEAGVATALIQRAELSQGQIRAAQVVNFCIGSAIATGLVLGAPAIARVLGQPELTMVVSVMGPSVFLSSLAATPVALLTRRMAFRRLAAIGLLAMITGGTVAVAVALAGGGLISLALQPLVSSLVLMVTSNVFAGVSPLPLPSRSDFVVVASFGSFVLLSTVLEVIFTRMYAVLLTRSYGTADVGLYARAEQTQALFSTIVGSVVSRLSLPVLSHSQLSDADLRPKFLRATTVLLAVNVPMFGLVAAVATPAVETAFGAEWSRSGPLLATLCLAAAVFPLQVLNVNLLLAFGRPGTFFITELIKKLIGFPVIVLCSFYGLQAMAWGYVAYAGVCLVLNTIPTRRRLGIGIFRQLAVGLSTWMLVLVAVLATAVVRLTWTAPPPVELIALTSVYLLVFVTGTAIWRPPHLDLLAAYAPNSLRRLMRPRKPWRPRW